MDTTSYSSIASYGIDEAATMSTIVLSLVETDNSNPLLSTSCAINVFPGVVKKMACIKFNQSDNEQGMLSFATGGETGFMYFWSVSRNQHLFRDLQMKDDIYYYMGDEETGQISTNYEKLLPKDVGIDSMGTACNQDVVKDFTAIAPGLLVVIEDPQHVPFQDVSAPESYAVDTGASAPKRRGKERVSDSDYNPEDDSDKSGSSDDVLPVDLDYRGQDTVRPSMMAKFSGIKSTQAALQLNKIDHLCGEYKTKVTDATDVFIKEVKAAVENNPYEALCENACMKLEELGEAIDIANSTARRTKKQVGREDVLALLRPLTDLSLTDIEHTHLRKD